MTDTSPNHQPTSKPGKRSTTRLIGLSLLCISLLGLTWWIIHKRLPKPAPSEVQASGLVTVRQIMATVSLSTWGGTQRGQILHETLGKLLADNRIIFTHDLADAGLTVRGGKGLKCIYIKVLLTENGQFQHHAPGLMCDVLYHEALHTRTKEANCIEQECDAFMAGLEAVCAFEQRPRPALFKVEGKLIGPFVLEKYPELLRDAQYKPLANEMDWLLEQVGLQPLVTQSPTH